MLKQVAKQTAQLITFLVILPLYITYSVICLISSRNHAFEAFSQLLSLFPGLSGSYLRVAFYRLAMKQCPPDMFIGFGTLFSHQETRLSKGVYIGPQCNIGKCHIEKDCLLGSGVHIMSGKEQHNFDDLDTPIRDQGGNFTSISIGEDTWIGNASLVLANVGKKCVIGAGSVVINDIPDYSIAVGNPAKIIKARNKV